MPPKKVKTINDCDNTKPLGTKPIGPIPIILESPNKIKKIQSIVSSIKGKTFIILASCGHFRELSNNYDNMGFTIKDKSVIVEYVEDKNKKNIISNLKTKCKSAKTIYLATDPDREGEAIAWHIMELLGSKKDYYRIKFNSITKNEVIKALESPLRIDMNLVLAQQTRKIIDKWIGFKVSPLCKTNISKYAKSAGRVQSPALKLIVEREREIRDFTSKEYFTINGHFSFLLDKVENKMESVSLKKYFDTKKPIQFNCEDDAMKVIDDIFNKTKKDKWIYKYIENESLNYSPPPYTTMTILQDCSNILKMKPEHTMLALQKMYESGWITYHRTDSVVLSKEGLFEARDALKEIHPELLSEKPKNFSNKSLNAQEAHEPIRPTHFEIIDLEAYLQDSDKEKLDPRIFKIYSMLYLRTIATQCIPLVNTVINLNFSIFNKEIEFENTYSFLKNLGWKKLYLDKKINKFYNKKLEDKEEIPLWIANMNTNNIKNIKLFEFELDTHYTKPPPYFTNSTLIKELETLGIGRPSTYASIISKLFDNNYIFEKDKELHPNEVGELLIDFLNAKYDKHFMNFDYTKNMEEILDKIAEGKCKWTNSVIEFITNFPK